MAVQAWRPRGPDGTCPHGRQCAVPLAQDGVSRSWPLAGPHQPEVVRATGAKEELQGQPGICEQQPWEAGLGPDEGGELVHVTDVVRLDGLAAAKPAGGGGVGTSPGEWRPQEPGDTQRLPISGSNTAPWVGRDQTSFLLNFVVFSKEFADAPHLGMPQP